VTRDTWNVANGLLTPALKKPARAIEANYTSEIAILFGKTPR